VSGTIDELPPIYSALIEHATLHDDFGVNEGDGTALLVTVQRASEMWPRLVVSQRFEPGPKSGFHPGAILVPDNELLLLGAGTRLLAYDLRAPKRLWEDSAEVGFLGWKRHDDVVVMSAELELAAWNLYGKKLWSTFVEPPWNYEVEGANLVLDVMGKKSSFDVKAGPRRDRAG
jgi:hypothetical protein